MGRLQKHHRSKAVVHIKYLGVTEKTRDNYKRALRHFFNYLRAMEQPLPAELEDLDHIGSEFINHVYMDDWPLYVARFFAPA